MGVCALAQLCMSLCGQRTCYSSHVPSLGFGPHMGPIGKQQLSMWVLAQSYPFWNTIPAQAQNHQLMKENIGVD